MNEYGTTFASAIYYAAAVILFILFGWYTVRKIISTVTVSKKELEDENKKFSEGGIIRTIILLIVVWVVYGGICIAGWNAKQILMSNSIAYRNPDEKKEIEKAEEHKPAPDNALVEKKDVLEKARDEKPHEEAIDSFDEAMKKEAEKIKNRN